MSNDAFSITSKDWERRAKRLAAVNVGLVVRESAVVVAHRLVPPLQQALRAAGGSAAAAGDVQVHDGHLNQLVMRNQGQRGDVIVGVSGESRHADEAEELEWGGIDTPPRAWVRTTAAKSARDVHTMWGNEMTRELDRRVL